MSLPQATVKRLSIIKRGLLEGKTEEDIAAECGVTRVTIARDKQKWLRSGEFDEWLREEWLRLHNIIQQQDPKEAYRQLSKLMGQTITRKIEQRMQVEGGAQPLIVKMWKPEDEPPTS